MRAIEFWRLSNKVLDCGRQEPQVRTEEMVMKKGSDMSTCCGSCKGKGWGPHSIHICDFDICV